MPDPMLDGSPYQGYLYAYPHKTAYRPLRPRPSLREVWSGEQREALFLYLHVPFCEMRCGFCNLFTRALPPREQVAAYLRQLRHEAAAVAEALGEARFALGAVGGGTPTYLAAEQLRRVFDRLMAVFVREGTSEWSIELDARATEPSHIELLGEYVLVDFVSRRTKRVS